MFAIVYVKALNGTPVSLADTFDPDIGVIQNLVIFIGMAVLYLELCIEVEGGGMRGMLGKWRSSSSNTQLAQANSFKVSDKANDELKIQDVNQLPPPVRGLPMAMQNTEDVASLKDDLAICAKEVTKSFGAFQAVGGVTLGVQRNELFGLLGANAAGKSVFINSICRLNNLEMDGGDAWINGYSTRFEIDQARSHLGLCAQFDALIPTLTARQHLMLFAAIRGIPQKLRKQVVEQHVARLNLGEKVDHKAGTYSGGQKRRLSTALAFFTHFSASFVDEPSTGLDPRSKRALWDFIENAKKEKGVVLTTHSMEEAEALSSRIGIMVNGNLRVHGTAQQLKDQHGHYYSVVVRTLGGDAVEKVVKAFQQVSKHTRVEGPGAKDAGGLEEGRNLVKHTVFVPREQATSMSQVFRIIEEVANSNSDVVDFAVSQVRLADIFLGLARIQEEGYK